MMLYEFNLSTQKSHFYDITPQVQESIIQSEVIDGIAIVYCPHTTASITINENGDPDVKHDLLLGLDHAFPDCAKFRHFEGNSAAHLKSSAVGASETIIIENGKPILGTWQSIYFGEFDPPRNRTFYVKVMGTKRCTAMHELPEEKSSSLENFPEDTSIFKLEEKKLSSTEYYRNSFLHIHEDDVLLPDGSESKRIVVTHIGAVCVIALTEAKELLLVRQYRYPLGTETIEIPAGKLEPDEEPIVTAKRELEEETGYTCESLELIGSYASVPGFSNETVHHFLASSTTLLEIAPRNDEGEFTELLTLTKEQAHEMIATGEIFDLKTVYSIQYLTLAGLW